MEMDYIVLICLAAGFVGSYFLGRYIRSKNIDDGGAVEEVKQTLFNKLIEKLRALMDKKASENKIVTESKKATGSRKPVAKKELKK